MRVLKGRVWHIWIKAQLFCMPLFLWQTWPDAVFFLVDGSWIWSSSWLIYVSMKTIKSLIATENYEHTVTTSRQTGYSFYPYDHLTAHVFQPSDFVSRTLLLLTGIMIGSSETGISRSVCRPQMSTAVLICLVGRTVLFQCALWTGSLFVACLSVKQVANYHCHSSGELQRVLLCGWCCGKTWRWDWMRDWQKSVNVLVFCFRILFCFLVSCLSIQKTVRINHRSQCFFFV